MLWIFYSFLLVIYAGFFGLLLLKCFFDVFYGIFKGIWEIFKIFSRN